MINQPLHIPIRRRGEEKRRSKKLQEGEEGKKNQERGEKGSPVSGVNSLLRSM